MKIYNKEQIVSVDLRLKDESSYYEIRTDILKRLFSKNKEFSKYVHGAFDEHIEIEDFAQKEPDYYIDGDKIYCSPYVIIRFSDDSGKRIVFDNREEAIEFFNEFCNEPNFVNINAEADKFRKSSKKKEE